MKTARGTKNKPAARAQKAARGGRRAKVIASGKLPDLSVLSEEELALLLELAEQELSSRRDRKREEFFSSVRAQAEALGVAPEEMAAELSRKGKRPSVERPGVDDRRAKVAPKYRNPSNPSETWAGRGARPKWMQALLAQGHGMEDFRITQ